MPDLAHIWFDKCELIFPLQLLKSEGRGWVRDPCWFSRVSRIAASGECEGVPARQSDLERSKDEFFGEGKGSVRAYGIISSKMYQKGQKNWKWRWRKKGMAKDSEAKLEYRLWEDGQLFLWNSWPAWWTALPMLMNKAGSAHVCQALNTPNRVSVQGCCGRRSSAMLYNGGLENTVMSYVRTQYAEDIIMGHIAQK